MTTTKEYQNSFLMGRMCPPHIGHKTLIDRALSLSDRCFLFLAYELEKTERTPLSYLLREKMVTTTYTNEVDTGRLIILPDRLMDDDEEWFSQFSDALDTVGLTPDNSVLVACNKYNNTYLNMFSRYPIEMVEHFMRIDGTNIRRMILNNEYCSQILLAPSLYNEVEKELRDR